MIPINKRRDGEHPGEIEESDCRVAERGNLTGSQRKGPLRDGAMYSAVADGMSVVVNLKYRLDGAVCSPSV